MALDRLPGHPPAAVMPSTAARWAITIAQAILLICWVPGVFIAHSIIIAGQRYFWLNDDMMISMRYARNLVRGNGLVWNPGERVEGYTNLLWTLYMALLHGLAFPTPWISLVVLLTNLGIALATLPLLSRLVHLLGGGLLAKVATLAAFVFSAHTMSITVEGFETPLLTCLFLLALTRILAEVAANRPRPSTYLLLGVLPLVHSDALILAALLGMAALMLTPDRRAVLRYAPLAVLFPLAQELFQLAYYGDLLPNTYYLKATRWTGRIPFGVGYVRDFARSYWTLAVLAAGSVAMARDRLRTVLAAVVMIHLGYVAYIGGDVFYGFRFFQPTLPVMAALAFRGVEELPFPVVTRAMACLVTLATLPLLLFNYRELTRPAPQLVGQLQIGLLLKQDTPAHALVGDVAAGSIFYFSDRPGVDFLGKSDKRIAHESAITSGVSPGPGHNKMDYDYAIGERKPAYVVAFFKWPQDAALLVHEVNGPAAYAGRLYINRFFRAHCLAHPMPWNTPRTVFHCVWH